MRKLSGHGKEGTREGEAHPVLPALWSIYKAPGAHDVAHDTVDIYLRGCRPTNPLNGSQCNPWPKMRERKQLRQRAFLEVCAKLSPTVRRKRGRRIVVLLGRIAPRPYDGDGWQAAAKSLRDGVADAFGLPDSDDVFDWRYDQGRGEPKYYAVLITIRIIP